MIFKVKDEVVLSPEKHRDWKVFNSHWEFNGPAFGEVVAILDNGEVRVRFWGYKSSGTHSVPPNFIIHRDVFESPLYQSLQE